MPKSEHHSNLFVVRHGDCGSEDHLTDRGRQQMVTARTLLHANIVSERTRILSSPKLRAIESARVLAGRYYSFEKKTGVVPWLDADKYWLGRADIQAELAARRHQDEQDGVQTLVLVMHELDIVSLMRALGPCSTPVGRNITLGSCWKLSTEPGEPHRQLEPAQIAA